MLVTFTAVAQVSVGNPTVPTSNTPQDLQIAMSGRWVGYLEYRDYSEPPTSNKRVQLATWLEIKPSDDGLTLHYIYDDGPNKIVESKETVKLDAAHARYVSEDNGKAREYHVSGFESLKGGLGTLILTGTGTENGNPAEFLVTLRVRRNILEWTEESRSPGAGEFAFRHMVRVTRAQAPTIK